MHNETMIVHGRQLAIRRELDRRGIPLKVVAFDSGIQYGTLLTYFPADADKKPHTISGAAIYMLCGALPADLISLLLPEGFQIVRAPECIDHDTLCDIAQDYVATKQAAHRQDSPGGTAIVDSERSTLDGKAVALAVAA